MNPARRPFREFDDSHDAESLRLARRIIRGLVLTMRHVLVCPGSRSAPMAYALAEAEQLGAVSLHMRIDERSAAFTALGIAMATGDPVGIVTTSGTAAGNLMPAVMEADMSGTPLVVVTADRPEALHGTGANQTTWQQGMFAGRVRDELHIDQSHISSGQVRLEPHARDDLLAAETQAALLIRAATQATPRSAPGPVHLNIGFADPLVPVAGRAGQNRSDPESAGVPSPGRWARKGVIPPRQREALYRAAGRSGVTAPRAGTPEVSPTEHLGAASLIDQMQASRAQTESTADPEAEPEIVRTLFVLGHAAPPDAINLAHQLGHPMLAEPTSGARWSDLGPVQGYRVLLQSAQGSPAAELVGATQRLVVAGRPTLTRPVQRLIARGDIEVVQYAPRAEPWFDQRLPRRVVTTFEELSRYAGRSDTEWSRRWESAGLRAQNAIDSVLREADEESGGERRQAPDGQDEPRLEPSERAAEPGGNSVRVAQFVAETVRTPLLLGSSSVIRDVDLAAALTRDPAASAPAAVYALRGLAGIDGNVSAAGGIAVASGRRATVLVGDLTFLHDVNALLSPTTERPPSLDVVVINDGGGAIFDQLEHGEVGRRPGHAEVVERLFGTPQTVDIEALADAYQHEYVYTDTLEDLRRALQHPDDRLGIRLIEVRTDRSRLRNLHERILQAAAEAQ